MPTPENDFVAFAIGAGANVLSQSAYLASSQLSGGQQPGVASSALNNKALRQATYIAACLAQFLANTTGNNVLDDGNSSEVITTMSQAFALPSGSIIAFGGTVAPVGYLMCDGTSYLQTSYPALYAAIGGAYGTADSSHFNVPDLRGRFVRGTDNGAGNDPDTISRTALNPGGNTGDNVGSLQTDDFASHSHALSPAALTFSGSFAGSDNFATRGELANTQSTGGDETRPKNVYANYIIKT